MQRLYLTVCYSRYFETNVMTPKTLGKNDPQGERSYEAMKVGSWNSWDKTRKAPLQLFAHSFLLLSCGPAIRITPLLIKIEVFCSNIEHIQSHTSYHQIITIHVLYVVPSTFPLSLLTCLISLRYSRNVPSQETRNLELPKLLFQIVAGIPSTHRIIAPAIAQRLFSSFSWSNWPALADRTSLKAIKRCQRYTVYSSPSILFTPFTPLTNFDEFWGQLSRQIPFWQNYCCISIPLYSPFAHTGLYVTYLK